MRSRQSSVRGVAALGRAGRAAVAFGAGLALAAGMLAGAVVTGAGLSPASATSCTASGSTLPMTYTCTYAGGTQTLTIPVGTGSMTITADGGGGGGTQASGGAGGRGARVSATLLTGSLTQVTVVVGGGGGSGSGGGSGGSNGGGFSAVFGGASATDPTAQLVVAGGGGGGGSVIGATGGNAAAANTAPGGNGIATIQDPGQGGAGGIGATLPNPATAGLDWSVSGVVNGSGAGAPLGAGANSGAGGGGHGYGGGSAGDNPGAGGGAGGSYVTSTGLLGSATYSPDGAAGGVSSSGTSGTVTIVFNGPYIASLSPASGPTTGGGLLTISGVTFGSTQGSGGVTVGGNSCPVTSWSATSIACTLPGHAAGAVDVVVSDGTSSSTPATFTYLAAPTLTSISPTAGPLTSPGTLTLTGTGFISGMTVAVGSGSCSSVSVASSTSATCTLPNASAGGVSVSVTTTAGTSGTQTFTYVATPTVTGVSPSTISTAGGQIVITGTNFVAGSSAVSVTVGGTACTPLTVDSATQITCTAPALSAGSQNVVVNSAGGASTAFALTTITPPLPPTGVTASTQSVGAGSVLVSWTAPGSGTTPTSYTATSSPGGLTCTASASPCTVTGLTPGVSYTFTVASSASGVPSTSASAASGAIVATGGSSSGGSGGGSTTTPTATVPSAPGAVTVTPGPGSLLVSWTPPSTTGGLSITRYIATATPGGASCTSGGTSCTITGLAPGAYSVSVVAVNGIGVGSPVASSAVVPAATDPLSPLGPQTGGAGASGAGALPAGGLTAGASLLLVDGQPATVTVRPNAAQVAKATALNASASGFTMTFAGRDDQDRPLGLTSTQALILVSEPIATRAGTSPAGTTARALDAARARRQPVVESSGSGFKPGTQVQLFVLPGTLVGSLTADANGEYHGRLPIPAGITAGAHTFQANGFAPSGEIRSLSLGVLVRSATAAAATRTAKAHVRFAPLSAVLGPQSKATLDALVKKTGRNGVKTVVVGFVQPAASAANDAALSKARAQAVASYLRSKGLKGSYVVRGDGRSTHTGAPARRVDVTVAYRR